MAPEKVLFEVWSKKVEFASELRGSGGAAPGGVQGYRLWLGWLGGGAPGN